MNSVKYKIRFICFLALSMLWVTAISATEAKSRSFADYIKRVENLNTVVDIRINEDVTGYIEHYISKRKRESEEILGRTSLYFPMIENVIREKNLPDELKYIAVIESNLRPDVVSRQGAAGLWQFMKGTALLFGMTIDKHVDERRDVYKSTDKALDYLRILYNQYGDWTLALAAYNCGSGKVNKAINQAGGKMNYWHIRKYLPKETQMYMPKFIAASYLMNYYYMHGMSPAAVSHELKHTSTVRVFEKMSLSKISEEFGVNMETLRFLNPMFVNGMIPASKDGQYYLTLPETAMFAFVEKYSSPEHLVFVPSNLNYDKLMAQNAARQKSAEFVTLLKNRSYSIRDNSKRAEFLNKLKDNLNPETKQFRLYKLGKKESLMDVAKAQNISLEELMRINNFTENSVINPGSVIRI